MEDLMPGFGVGSTLTKVNEKGHCLVRVMNPHTEPMRLNEGSQLGVTSMSTRIEIPYPVALAPMADQRGHLGAREKALRIASTLTRTGRPVQMKKVIRYQSRKIYKVLGVGLFCHTW